MAKENFEYGDISPILAEDPPHKRLFYVPTIKQAEEFADEIRKKTGRNTMVLWSKTNKEHHFSSQQLELINYLQLTHKYPDELDDLLTTETHPTYWYATDNRVQEMYIHSGNKKIQEQFGDFLLQE